MSDSDADELAELRRERAQRLGHAGLTVTSLRKQHDDTYNKTKHKDRSDNNNDEDGPVVVTDIPNDDDDDIDDGIPEEFRAHFPTSFGAPSRKKSAPEDHHDNNNIDDDYNNKNNKNTSTLIEHAPIHPHFDDNNEDDNNNNTTTNTTTTTTTNNSNPWNLPISSEAILTPHSKAVISLDLDHSGARLLTGSTDYTVKIFDFNGMKSDCKPFTSIEPSEGYPVVGLSWSPSGDAFLAITSSTQPKIYDREGREMGELPRGDMYIRDMKNTKGHVSACTGGKWHPIDKNIGMTCSEDGTIRTWDLRAVQQQTVIKPTLAKPGRVAVTSCVYNTVDGRMIAAGLADGSLQLWDIRGKFGHSAAVGVVPQPKAQMVAKQTWSYVSRTNQVVRNAHQPENDITCVAFSQQDGGHMLLSRGSDNTLKLWDIRSFKKPVAVHDNLPVGFGTTQCCFSPDESLVLTGVGSETKEQSGYLGIYKKDDLSLVQQLGVPGNCVAVQWHPKINQILIGCGNRKEGMARVLYDTTLSTRGAMLAVGRRPRQESSADVFVDVAPRIINPNALPLYREEVPGLTRRGGKRSAQVDLSVRTSKSFKPEVGQAGSKKGAQGALGTTGGTLLTQYIMKHQGELKNPADEDVRASILRHAGKEDEFSRFTAAYAKTQPTRVYAEMEEEEDGGEGDGGK